ncbi:histidine phosphatase family protein [Marimonas arenosa]|uniref:Histidine phosphatase family protein n=1 Tax=Marimonas arenosa TaxID=1795305 RepID=A0AAE3W8Z0_9RHOB|nr:histidine phosphatase family protein [Marimonas arenosa]MDQ2088404.1 histidine phosphatase family protein [Marimonas arenosa]
MSTHPPLFLLRHGQTDWNRDRRIQGQMESQLTELGRGHATRQGEILAGLDLPEGIAAFCSPQRRTRQTAEIALGAVELDPMYDDRLKEVYLGSWEGHLRADLEGKFPEVFAGRSVFQTCLMSDGESEADLRARVGAFLTELDRPAVVVSHGIALTFLRGLVLGASLEEMDAMERAQGVVIELNGGVEITHR